ncbi:CbiX/SirB N-terminal domain-containing protein [Actinoplanes sp. NBRC 103695]|uniref:sirohydrochlorin chelatase n=1 Tax=Actinoplanes sp. NBRC 103695 TaxID=3032202 RepID=UPI00255778B3|nr:CbiX/SirB N-terminal domain-containing protein [Actinoplanes sp. NBRC 103695]
MSAGTLVAVAHGTRSAAGQAQIRALVDAVAMCRPELDVRLAYVDVQQPRVAEVMRMGKQSKAVIVPLLLSTGFHVRVDIAEAAGDSVVTPPLGPDPLLTEILAGSAGRDHDALVLAAAGSSDPGWRAEIADVASQLDAHVAYASRDETKDVVADLRRQGAERITVAAYLLAEGRFYRSLHQAKADRVTPPLCHDPRVAGLVARRYDLTSAPARM